MEPCYTMLGSVVGNRGNRESSPLDGTRKMSEGLNIDLGSRNGGGTTVRSDGGLRVVNASSLTRCVMSGKEARAEVYGPGFWSGPRSGESPWGG